MNVVVIAVLILGIAVVMFVIGFIGIAIFGPAFIGDREGARRFKEAQESWKRQRQREEEARNRKPDTRLYNGEGFEPSCPNDGQGR